VTAGFVLIGAGAFFSVLWGLLLPRLDRRIPTRPKILADDPQSLASFRRKNQRQGITVGIVLAALGIAVLIVSRL
jgi:hypothetical protein